MDKIFSERLNQALKMRGMKAVELHRATGISESTISQYRSGYAMPKNARLKQIAQVLDVNPLWLLGMTSESKYNPFDIAFEDVMLKLTDGERGMIQKLRALPDGDIDFVNRYIDAKYNDNY